MFSPFLPTSVLHSRRREASGVALRAGVCMLAHARAHTHSSSLAVNKPRGHGSFGDQPWVGISDLPQPCSDSDLEQYPFICKKSTIKYFPSRFLVKEKWGGYGVQSTSYMLSAQQAAALTVTKRMCVRMDNMCVYNVHITSLIRTVRGQ